MQSCKNPQAPNHSTYVSTSDLFFEKSILYAWVFDIALGDLTCRVCAHPKPPQTSRALESTPHQSTWHPNFGWKRSVRYSEVAYSLTLITFYIWHTAFIIIDQNLYSNPYQHVICIRLTLFVRYFVTRSACIPQSVCWSSHLFVCLSFHHYSSKLPAFESICLQYLSMHIYQMQKKSPVHSTPPRFPLPELVINLEWKNPGESPPSWGWVGPRNCQGWRRLTFSGNRRFQ